MALKWRRRSLMNERSVFYRRGSHSPLMRRLSCWTPPHAIASFIFKLFWFFNYFLDCMRCCGRSLMYDKSWVHRWDGPLCVAAIQCGHHLSYCSAMSALINRVGIHPDMMREHFINPISCLIDISLVSFHHPLKRFDLQSITHTLIHVPRRSLPTHTI